MIRLISIIALMFCVSSGAQTWNQAESLTNLLTRPPVVGGWYSVKGYRTPGDWGSERTAQYVRGDTTTTNIGNVFNWSGGRLKFFDATNSVQDLRWWGVFGDGSTNTTRIQSAIDYGRNKLQGLTLVFPPGETFTGPLTYWSNMTFRGENRRSTTLTLAGDGTLFSPYSTGLVRSVAWERMRLRGTTNGIGILLDSVEKPRVSDVEIATFRGDTNSFGLLIQNNYGNSHSGFFDGLNINSCQNALTIRSVNGTYSAGYHTFSGLMIDQELNGIQLLKGAGNGGIYNTFSGVFIQGNGASGDHVVIGGIGNKISGLVIDAIGTGRVWLTSDSSGNRVEINQGLSSANVQDDQSSGALNSVVDAGSMFSPHPERYWKFGVNEGNADFRFSTASTNGVSLSLGNSTASDVWGIEMGSGASPMLSVLQNGNVASQWEYRSAGSGNFSPVGPIDWDSGGVGVIYGRSASTAPTSGPGAGKYLLYMETNRFKLWSPVGKRDLSELEIHASEHEAFGSDPVAINALTNTGSVYLESANGYGFRYSNGNTIKSLLTDAGTNLYLSVLGANDFYLNIDGTNLYRINPSTGHTWKNRNGGTLATLGSSGLSSSYGIATKASTNIGTHVLTFASDPTSGAQTVGAMTIANVKNSLGIVSTDITDSTSAGRALLTAANAAAQRSSLGLGTIATIDDAPSDGNQYVRSNATWAIASGGGGGISGIRVTDGTTDADGITNILFNPAGGSGFAITVSDLGTQANVDFEWLSPGFGINGTFPTYGTERWNINSTTPSAPAGYKNLSLATSTTNAVIRDRAGYFLTETLTGTNNSAAEFIIFTNTIAAGWLRDGSRAQLSGLLRTMNNTGSSRTTTIKLFVGSSTYTFSDNNPGAASSFRGNHYSADIFRSGTNLFIKVINAVDNAPGTPSSGGSISSTTVSGPNSPRWSQGVSDLDANDLPISLSVTMAVASTNYWATNVFTQISPE